MSRGDSVRTGHAARGLLAEAGRGCGRGRGGSGVPWHGLLRLEGAEGLLPAFASGLRPLPRLLPPERALDLPRGPRSADLPLLQLAQRRLDQDVAVAAPQPRMLNTRGVSSFND